ncbi:hypothetical protein [Spirillospora sp. NPDC047279]|uniref:hypothetical protein n=1 Tax=Spirillospora sp. NPDC047279 TaxID=3155478 RepID=UPI0033E4258D
MKPPTLIIGTAVIAGVLATTTAAAAADPSSGPGPSTPSAPAAPTAPKAVHGESVVKGADGWTRVYTWQTGTITEKGGTRLTVRSSDGTTYAWVLNGRTRHRAKSWEVGDTVMVGGPRDGQTRTAALVTTPSDFGEIRERLKDLKLPDRPELPELPRLP